MGVATTLERKIDQLQEQINDMEAHNDGSLRWVDDARALHQELWEAQEELAQHGGYREAGERF